MFTHFYGDDIKVYTNFFDKEVTSTVQLVAVENGAPIDFGSRIVWRLACGTQLKAMI